MYYFYLCPSSSYSTNNVRKGVQILEYVRNSILNLNERWKVEISYTNVQSVNVYFCGLFFFMEFVECGKLRWEINNVVEYISYKKIGRTK